MYNETISVVNPYLAHRSMAIWERRFSKLLEQKLVMQA